MTVYKLHVRGKALKDMNQIRDYIKNILRNQKAAFDFVNAVNSKFEKIAENPYIYPCEKIKGTMYRKAMVKQYIIAFSVDEPTQTVNIMAVGHSRQKRINLIKQ